MFEMANKHGASVLSPFPEPRLIPTVVSERAKNEPQKVWASIPRSPTNASDGFEDITFARLNYAVTRAARWMQKTLGSQESSPHRPLAYIGPPDTRYITLTIAAIKTGFKVFFVNGFSKSMRRIDLLRTSSLDAVFVASEQR